jgi:hypothetical protein
MAGIMARSRVETKAKLAGGIDGKSVQMLDAPAEMRDALIEVALADSANWIAKANEKGFAGEEIFGDWIALTEKWAGEVSANGYPWD